MAERGKIGEKEQALSLQPIRGFPPLLQGKDPGSTAQGLGEIVGDLDDGQAGLFLLTA